MTKKKTYKVLDLFCGCGGISEGYALAGFDIVGGIDFNEYATITFQHNFKNARVHNIDITTFSDEQIAEEYSDVDVIVGGPPCPDFSVAGKNKGKEGENGRLSQTYADLREWLERV